MATLQKNGIELARFELLKKTLSYRSNGVCLVNKGFGWKRQKLAEGWTVEKSIEYRNNEEERMKRERPCFLKYRSAVHDVFPLSNRWEYFAALDMLADDIDGIWSELNDRGHGIDLETLEELAALKRASSAEFKALKIQKVEE